MVEKDPYVGERFADKDWRNEGRIVKVVRGNSRRYQVEVVAHPQNPGVVGRTSFVTASTLDAKYRKVSH